MGNKKWRQMTMKGNRTITLEFQTGSMDIGDMSGSRVFSRAREAADRAISQLNDLLNLSGWLDKCEVTVTPYGASVVYRLALAESTAEEVNKKYSVIQEAFAKQTGWRADKNPYRTHVLG